MQQHYSSLSVRTAASPTGLNHSCSLSCQLWLCSMSAHRFCAASLVGEAAPRRSQSELDLTQPALIWAPVALGRLPLYEIMIRLTSMGRRTLLLIAPRVGEDSTLVPRLPGWRGLCFSFLFFFKLYANNMLRHTKQLLFLHPHFSLCGFGAVWPRRKNCSSNNNSFCAHGRSPLQRLMYRNNSEAPAAEPPVKGRNIVTYCIHSLYLSSVACWRSRSHLFFPTAVSEGINKRYKLKLIKFLSFLIICSFRFHWRLTQFAV